VDFGIHELLISNIKYNNLLNKVFTYYAQINMKKIDERFSLNTFTF